LRWRAALVPLGGRAFDILSILVRSSGQLIGKRELIDRIWPNATVEENTLRIQIFAIRKALGPEGELLKTVSGRGYCLLGAWTIREASASTHLIDRPEHGSEAGFRTNVATSRSALVGRTRTKQHLLDVLTAYRVVTLTGPGGIGKSVLGVELARDLFPEFGGDCWFIPLASLSDPALVPSMVASVLGLSLGGDEISAEAVARAIAEEKILLVLDNCEHVIGVAASLVETIVRTCPNATVLATSQETLRVEGEYVYRVPPLDVPPQPQEDADGIHEYSAVRLFVDRLLAFDPGLSVRPEHLLKIAAICRRLDGIPLAIEFAAAHVSTLGFEQVVALLHDRFSLLVQGRRTALPRHQTLRATLSWSYDLVTDSERLLLRRLAVFSGGFTLEAATAVMNDNGRVVFRVDEAIASLVAKSLVAICGSTPSGRWRLLETIRAYASEKLVESGEVEQIARRHAEFYRDLVVAGVSAPQLPPSEYLARHACEIDNVRAALDWCFSPTGDTGIGLPLTAAFCPVWLDISLLAECRERIERALEYLTPDSKLAPRLEMQMQITLGIVQIITLGPAGRIKIALTKGNRLADHLADLDAQLQASWALWALHFNAGEHETAKSAAERFASIAARAKDPVIVAVACRMMGYTLQYMGRQREARERLENVVHTGHSDNGQRHKFRFLYDQQLVARASLARSLWLQGFSDQANDLAHACLAEARAGSNKLTLCFVLGLAVCPVALMRGDITGADRSVAMLMESATRQSFTQYVNVGRSLAAMLMIERGEFAAASGQLRVVRDTFEKAGWRATHPELAGALAMSLAGGGQVDEALATLEQGLASAEQGGMRWYVPELLRIKGELLRRYEAGEIIQAAEGCFEQSIDLARQQGALFWELRTALSQARLMTEQSRIADAQRALSTVYRRFTEGFETRDLREARMLLEKNPKQR
jgi:predicted ATPase/DNA-binding winged helix-turn-helix (wHTH) protein